MFEKIKTKIYKKIKTKPNLLIAGYDLKFINPAINYLEKHYNIKVEYWSEDINEEITKQKKENLNWADIIFCEWLHHYAIWYSNNVKPSQKLFIRAHKSEITLYEYAEKINFNNVTGVITINFFLLELFSNIFSIPREKMYYLNNFIETTIYPSKKEKDYLKHITVVGYIPRLKGYYRSLEILNNLRKHDDFKLYLYGKDWKDVGWIINNPKNKKYIDKCSEFIKTNNLENSIIKNGWVERKNMFSKSGFVLSVSDIEGSHLSITESFADTTVGALINWAGVEYVYPKEIIFENVDELSDFILNTYADEEKYLKLANKLKQYCEEEFGEEYFINNLINIFEAENSQENKFSMKFNEFKQKYYNDNIPNEKKILNDFENSYIINDEKEIEQVISKSKKPIRLFLSNKIETIRIKNIYQKYASKDVCIYSLYFFENLDKVQEFVEMCNEHHHRSNIKFEKL